MNGVKGDKCDFQCDHDRQCPKDVEPRKDRQLDRSQAWRFFAPG